ncbi:MAG: PilZ domain-containing protein [Thermodesulfovibrionales bacterium]
MTEARKHTRYVVEGMGIFAKTMWNADIEVIDISTQGASIRSTTRFSIGREYIFTFGHSPRVLSVKGVIAWENLTGSKKIAEEQIMPIYTAGIEFRDLLTDTAEEIRKFIKEKMTELKEHRLSGVRVRIHPRDKQVLNYLETCVVKDVSLGGVRIETELKPSVDTVFPIELVISEDGSSIDCEGRVVFCLELPAETGHRHSVGVEFMQMAGEDKLRLKTFIDTLSPNVVDL